jgi:hypothetical protein
MLIVEFYEIPVVWSLGTTALILAVTMVLSLVIPPPAQPAHPGSSSLAGAPSTRLRRGRRDASDEDPRF